MGNDGGSIPTRRELVKNAARTKTVSELKATALESLAHAWTHDALTSEPLDVDNVVSDWHGRLYNYESILKALMPSADDEAAADDDRDDKNGDAPQELTFAATGIKSLRDIVQLKFHRVEQKATGSNGSAASRGAIWACPVSLKELGSSVKAVYIVPCGHVFADIAMKQIQEELCPECSEAFKSEDVIPILPTDKAEVEKLQARLDDLKARGLTHSLKKDKSGGKKKHKRKAEEGDGEANEPKEKKAKTKENGKDIASRVSGINNPATASLTARVLAEQKEMNKRRKLAAAR